MFIISDIHLNDGSRKDDFKGGERRLVDFLNSIPDKSLVLNGDILDLWESPLDDILNQYGEIVSLLCLKARWYVVGNHDRQMFDLYPNGEFRGVPLVEKLILGDTLIMHGHQFDFANSEGNLIGPTVTRIVSWLEGHGLPDIDRYASKLERWIRRQGRFGTPATYREKAFAFIRALVYNGISVHHTILGHTHKLDNAIHGQFVYENCGTWTNKQKGVVTI